MNNDMEIIASRKTALLVGATGMVGRALLDRLLAHGAYGKVIAPTRRSLHRDHGKLSNPQIDFSKLDRYPDIFRVQDIFIALGTTIKKAGSKKAFREVDFDFIVNSARQARRGGANQCMLVSSAGANSESPFFYSQVKGETEEAISHMDYWAVHVFRPGVLLGARDELRPAELITGKVTGFLQGISPRILGDYNPTKVEDLARHMLRSAQNVSAGIHFHGARELGD